MLSQEAIDEIAGQLRDGVVAALPSLAQEGVIALGDPDAVTKEDLRQIIARAFPVPSDELDGDADLSRVTEVDPGEFDDEPADPIPVAGVPVAQG